MTGNKLALSQSLGDVSGRCQNCKWFGKQKSEIYSEGRIALTMGSGCDSVGVEVASNTIGSRFESGHQLMNKFIVNS